MTTSDPPPGEPSRALRLRAADGWERFMRRVEAKEGGDPVGADGLEEHPLLNTTVRDVASGCEGTLTAVVRELHERGRVVRIAYVRPASGVEFTTSAANIHPARSHTMATGNSNDSEGGSGGGGGSHGGGSAPISTPPPPPPSNPDTSTPPGGGKHR
ncbi:hypothetical protein [Streptomyces sp. NPDC101115]|uniref:hypothetical protein n=1 Tax=Streptomyces sp. NPDC101115 TaxID=3366106 RepID=UPI0038216F22